MIRNLAFVLWIIGWPTAAAVCRFLLAEAKPIEGIGAIIFFGLWIFIAYLVYEGKPNA